MELSNTIQQSMKSSKHPYDGTEIKLQKLFLIEPKTGTVEPYLQESELHARLTKITKNWKNPYHRTNNQKSVNDWICYDQFEFHQNNKEVKDIIFLLCI